MFFCAEIQTGYMQVLTELQAKLDAQDETAIMARTEDQLAAIDAEAQVCLVFCSFTTLDWV
jgi:hypothetical protein